MSVTPAQIEAAEAALRLNNSDEGTWPTGEQIEAIIEAVVGTVATGVSGMSVTTVPDGQLRIYEPELTADDIGRMYVLDVFAKTVLVRERFDGVLVHIDSDGDSPAAKVHTGLIYEIGNDGFTYVGE